MIWYMLAGGIYRRLKVDIKSVNSSIRKITCGLVQCIPFFFFFLMCPIMFVEGLLLIHGLIHELGWPLKNQLKSQAIKPNQLADWPQPLLGSLQGLTLIQRV